jgi:hypothetical protein
MLRSRPVVTGIAYGLLTRNFDPASERTAIEERPGVAPVRDRFMRAVQRGARVPEDGVTA